MSCVSMIFAVLHIYSILTIISIGLQRDVPQYIAMP